MTCFSEDFRATVWRRVWIWGGWWGAEECSKFMTTFISQYSESQRALAFGLWLEY